jgi:hypothetical protein
MFHPVQAQTMRTIAVNESLRSSMNGSGQKAFPVNVLSTLYGKSSEARFVIALAFTLRVKRCVTLTSQLQVNTISISEGK